MHEILRATRINPKREFFAVETRDVKLLFDLIDGEMWTDNPAIDKLADDVLELSVGSATMTTRSKTRRQQQRVMELLDDNQNIRHIVNGGDEWVGVYLPANNTIICNGATYKGDSPLNSFAAAHLGRKSDVDFWKECEIEIDGEWVSAAELANEPSPLSI